MIVKVPQKSLLWDPLFRKLWTTVELSFLGGFVHVVACSWLIATQSDSATLVALTQTAYSLPMVIFSMLAGALADVHDQRKTMLWALSFSMLASGLLALSSVFGILHPWTMLGLLFAVGMGVTIFTPSWQASLGSIVERERLTEAVSLHNMGANVMRTIGPTLGGFLITYAAATTTFLVGALSYVPALATLAAWKHPAQTHGGTRETISGAIGSGIRYLLASPHLLPILMRVFTFSFSAVAITALLPLIVKNQLGGDGTDYGILFGAFGLGAILGGVALRGLRQRHDPDWIVRRAFLINIVALACLAASRHFALGLPATIVAGGCWLIAHSLQNTTLQLASPRWMVGRMVSMFITAAFLGLAIGSWFWGLVSERSSTNVALALAAGAMGVSYLIARFYPLPDTSNLRLEPVDQATATMPKAEIDPRQGPVIIHLEHHIANEALGEFEQVMTRRRRHLTGLGARRWTLAEEHGGLPGSWIETIEFRTWGDYQRMMMRRTEETLALRQAVRLLQQNGNEPAIRRFVTRNTGGQHGMFMLRT